MTIDASLLGAALGEALAGKMPEYSARPARLDELQDLLEGCVQRRFQVGDIVQLRSYAIGRQNFPTEDDRCIVTQVLSTPYRLGNPSSLAAGEPHDIALAFVDSDGGLVEFLYDSRIFKKVGSIYDPVRLPDGEVLPVE